MKRFIISLLVIVVLSSCGDSNGKLSTDLVNNPTSADANNISNTTPKIEFQKTEHNFGKILQGEQVSYTFRFKNTGNAPLIISSIEKTCGCTSPDYTSQPIKPGDEGKITITYDSKGHNGFQNKRLIVRTNTNPSETILRIKAQVENINTF